MSEDLGTPSEDESVPSEDDDLDDDEDEWDDEFDDEFDEDEGETDDELPAAAVILTKVVLPGALAAACALNKVAVDSVRTSIGCVAVCRSTGAGDPETAAQIISGLLTTTPVVLLVQREGQMTASRWSAGEEQEELSPALVLSGAPQEIEDLLFGQVTLDELPDVVASAGMSRWRAMRILAGVARANRRAAKSASAGDTPDDTDDDADGD